MVDVTEKKKIQYQDNQNTTGLQFLETRSTSSSHFVEEVSIGEIAGSYSFFPPPLNQIKSVKPLQLVIYLWGSS
uniref:Uncharacterized protein n=1 Tax=Sciurus vulgaris TaxID=55149 RepID=A0A8D2BAZ2_SCIVU